mgnify:CR=1 FL=1
MSKTILILDDYLSSNECDELVTLYENTKLPDTSKDFSVWSGRVKWPIYPKYLDNKLNAERTRVCEEYFGKKFKLLNPNMTFWKEGHEMSPHSDYGGVNEFPEREYASIIYLKDDFEGGELYIPELNFENKPKKGQLVCFQGGKMMHGVRMVTKGTRLTHICWFEVL